MEKRFFCQECRHVIIMPENAMPKGWLSMIRSGGTRGDYDRLGMFCSFDCLMARAPRMQYEIELLESRASK